MPLHCYSVTLTFTFRAFRRCSFCSKQPTISALVQTTRIVHGEKLSLVQVELQMTCSHPCVVLISARHSEVLVVNCCKNGQEEEKERKS